MEDSGYQSEQLGTVMPSKEMEHQRESPSAEKCLPNPRASKGPSFLLYPTVPREGLAVCCQLV